MNVPNRYKGFSQLPENVQQRMDPSLAKKYQMGGSVMQRPLFRQMGGPTDMMPQDMMPPPPMAGAPMAPPPMAPPPMDPMAEQMMAAESMGESAGANVADAMMMQIDGAQDYESLIDGIRGNELPLDARYQELAGLVGEADAMATPESVLALTQPTIMMTEQGAMDSGIGELMQGIAGDVEMSGPMDDGVGSLMAAGAGNTPPVNFRNGGPVEVRGFSNGTPAAGNSSVIAQAQAMAPDYQKYFAGAMDSEARAADLEEQKRMSQAQMLFDIAGAGLAFAGETQGGTAAERLANALTRTQLTDKIGSRSAGILDAKRAQAAEDRQLRMASLQGALGQAQIDEKARQDMALAGAKQGEETIKGVPISIWNTLDQETKDLLLKGKEGTVNGVPLSIYNKLSASEKRVVVGVQAKEANNIKGVPTDVFNKLSVTDQNRLLLGDPQGVNGVPRDIYDNLSDADKKSVLGTTDGPVKGIPAKVFEALSDKEKARILTGDPQGVNGVPRDIYDKLSDTDKKSVLGTTDGPIKGIPAKVFEALSDKEKERVLLGDPQGVNGIPMSIYDNLSDADKKSVLGLAKDVKGIPMSIFETLDANQKERVLLGDPQGVNGVPRDIYNNLSAMAKKKVLGTSNDPIKGLPREVFDKLSATDQNRFILGDPEGVKGVPRDIYDALSAEAQALIVDPQAQSDLAVKVKKDEENRKENRPYTKVINDQIVLINPAKPDEKPKVIFDASGLSSIFGNNTVGITMSIATDEALLEKYAANTLDPEVDNGVSNSTMESALDAYTKPTSNNFDKSSKDFKITPALSLNNAQIRALRARKAAGFELPPNVYFPENETEEVAAAMLNTPRPQDVAPLGEFLTDEAWGSAAFLKTAANVATEFIFLPAYWKEAKNATDAVKNLNQEFEQMLLESQGLRESVFQGKKIEVLTPNPANPFVGPESAQSKSLLLHLRLKDMITRFETQIGDELIFMDDTGKNSVGVKRSILPVLRQLSAGYQLLAKHDIASRGGDPSSIETYQRNQLIKKLDELSSKPKVEPLP